MNAHTQRQSIAGPGGAIECAIDAPAAAPRGLAVVCHPHPQHGGTLDNKVVQTLARAFVQLGYRAVRFNFRGVGASQGAWAGGPGEIDDALAVVGAFRAAGQPLLLAGFSFGGYVQTRIANRLADGIAPPRQLVLVGMAAGETTGSARHYETPPVPKNMPTLLIHGENDETVALTNVLDWARPQELPVIVVPGADHFFHGKLHLIRDLVARNVHRADEH